MKRIFTLMLASAVISSVSYLRADEQEKAPAEASPAGEENGEVVAAEGMKEPAKNPFYQLVRLLRIDAGKIELKRPRETKWMLGEEGKFYPNGTEFRAVVLDPEDEMSPAPQATFEFGSGCLLLVTNVCTFATREIPIGSKTRTVIPKNGTLKFVLPRTLPVNSMCVAAPHFVLKDLAGESIVDYRIKDDGDECLVNVITGQMAAEGMNFRIARMAAANQMVIRSLSDGLFTSIRCEAGTYVIKLDQGTLLVKNFVDGTSKEEEKTLEYELSPQCAVKIFRKRSRTAGRMVADVMTFAANGEMQNHCSFAEKRYNVNTGELVLKPGQAEALKAAAEAALEAAKAEADANASIETTSSSTEEKKEEE